MPPRRSAQLSQFRIAPGQFRAGCCGPSVARALGAIVSYQASAAGATTFSVRRAVVRRGSACGFHAKSARKRACGVWVALAGSFPHVDSAGLNRFRFTGRLQGRRLAPGVYLLAAVPHDAAGSPGRAKHAHFTVSAAGQAGARRLAAR